MLNHAAAARTVLVMGLVLLVIGRLTASANVAVAASLLGGALVLAVAIRVLAGLGGLHEHGPHLAAREELLLETPAVSAERRFPLLGTHRGVYRARLTNRRILLSFMWWRVRTNRDVTIATFAGPAATALRGVEILTSASGPAVNGDVPGQVILRPRHRRAPSWTLHVSNANRWREVLAGRYPELLS
ncbi:MAG: hypothetical protein ACRDHX_07160 [Chloroflexota bacterium]